MAEQRRIGYKWNLRTMMAQRNLWKSTELMPLLKSRGINLSESQIYRLVTGTPERIPARTFAALCDILDCEPNDLLEPYVEMRTAKTADAPKRPPGRATGGRNAPATTSVGLLVEHGALPRRDELAARYNQWATSALERVSNDHRDVVRRYIRWHLQRRMNQMEAVPHGTFLRAKQTVTVAIKSELVDSELTITRHRRGTSPKLSKAEQDKAIERVVHTNALSVRDRAAAILVIVFGQHIEDVVRLTWDNVTVTDELVTIRLGKTEFALPSPLDEPMRELAAAPGNDLTAAHPNSNWVFRGYSPSRHIHGASLRERLKAVFGTRAARLGTLHELTKLGPVPIIADALGYHPSTIERHAIASASTYAEYIAAARDQRQTS